MELYKIGLVSETWTAQVRTRLVRDMLTIDRLARKRGIQLVLACNHDISGMFAGVVDVTTTDNLVGCDMFRVYIDFDNRVTSDSEVADPMSVLDRLPEDADYEVIEINRGKRLPGLKIEIDPYAGSLPVNHDIQSIMPTIDLNKPPPQIPDNYQQEFMM